MFAVLNSFNILNSHNIPNVLNYSTSLRAGHFSEINSVTIKLNESQENSILSSLESNFPARVRRVVLVQKHTQIEWSSAGELEMSYFVNIRTISGPSSCYFVIFKVRTCTHS